MQSLMRSDKFPVWHIRLASDRSLTLYVPLSLWLGTAARLVQHFDGWDLTAGLFSNDSCTVCVTKIYLCIVYTIYSGICTTPTSWNLQSLTVWFLVSNCIPNYETDYSSHLSFKVCATRIFESRLSLKSLIWQESAPCHGMGSIRHETLPHTATTNEGWAILNFDFREIVLQS